METFGILNKICKISLYSRESFKKIGRPHLKVVGEELPFGGKFTSYGTARARPHDPVIFTGLIIIVGLVVSDQ